MTSLKASSKPTTPKPEKPATEPKKRQAKPKQEKSEFHCEFCKKAFARESSILSHVCPKKRRWLDKDEKYVKMGFIVFKKFYDMNFRNAKPRTYSDFMDSTHYNSFVKFGKYMLDIQAINPDSFVEFLLKAAVPMKNWELPFVYEQYIRELNKRESASTAFERNVLLMQQWEHDTGEPWYDFFRKVSTNLAVQWIRSGRLSPWVLYTASSASELFTRFNEEQIKLIEQYVNPRFWERKFAENPEDLKFVKELLDEAGV